MGGHGPEQDGSPLSAKVIWGGCWIVEPVVLREAVFGVAEVQGALVVAEQGLLPLVGAVEE